MNTHVAYVLLWCCDLTIHLYIILRENIIVIFFYLNFVSNLFFYPIRGPYLLKI